MTASDAAGLDLGLVHNTEYLNIVDSMFLRRALAEGLSFVSGARWITAADIGDAPGEHLAAAAYSGTSEALVRTEDGIAHLILNDRSLLVRVAAGSRAAATQVHEHIAAALPELSTAGLDVRVRIWWWGRYAAEDMARTMSVPTWQEAAENYVGATRTRLERLMDWSQPPAGGRLILLHGEPGTGKTRALRALAGQWRDWAEFQFITDPERFLDNPTYLMHAIMPRRSRTDAMAAEPWRIIVLEDAGEFLVPDARQGQGQAFSRLLNATDGVLGEAMKALIVVTTNEPLRSLHHALSRPGRCLAEIHFERFGRDAAAGWLQRHSVAAPTTNGALSLAELFAMAEGRERSEPGPRAVGFAPG